MREYTQGADGSVGRVSGWRLPSVSDSVRQCSNLNTFTLSSWLTLLVTRLLARERVSGVLLHLLVQLSSPDTENTVAGGVRECGSAVLQRRLPSQRTAPIPVPSAIHSVLTYFFSSSLILSCKSATTSAVSAAVSALVGGVFARPNQEGMVMSTVVVVNNHGAGASPRAF